MIVVAGKNDIAVHALNYLVNHLGNEAIIALPNKNDIGEDNWQRSLLLAAREKQVRIKALEEIENTSISLFLSLEYDRIIKPSSFPNSRLYNFHFSCLPRYKGMYTAIWPILYGDKKSGVTLHTIDQGIDTGDIHAQRGFVISNADRSRDIYRKCISTAIDLFDETIGAILSDSLPAKSQSAEGSSYFAKDAIDFSRLQINFQCTAWELKLQIYAYSFREYQLPNVFGKPIVEIDITDKKSKYKPGTILEESGEKLTVSTIDYDVILYVDRLPEVLARLPTCGRDELPALLKHVAGIHDRNELGWSPIIVAAFHGNTAAIEYLLENGADVNDRNRNGTTVLMYAKDYCLTNKNKEIFDLLTEAGSDPSLKDYRGKALVDYITTDEARYLGL